MEKNTIVVVYYEARNVVTGALLTGDVANHTVEVSKDGGTFVASAGVKAEILRADGITGSGVYKYTPTQAETNASAWELFMSSATTNVKLTRIGMYTQTMRGTDGANTVAPATPANVTAVSDLVAAVGVLTTAVKAVTDKVDTMIEVV